MFLFMTIRCQLKLGIIRSEAGAVIAIFVLPFFCIIRKRSYGQNRTKLHILVWCKRQVWIENGYIFPERFVVMAIFVQFSQILAVSVKNSWIFFGEIWYLDTMSRSGICRKFWTKLVWRRRYNREFYSIALTG